MSVASGKTIAALTFGAVLVGSGGLTEVALAAPPDRVVETVPFTIPTWANCDAFGGAGIISATGTIERRIQVRSSADGSVQEVRNVRFTGTLTGSSGTATYEGSFRALFEDPAGLFVRTGQSTFHLPGRTAPLVMAGRAVVLGEDLEFVTPKAHLDDSTAAVCAAIGG